MPMWVWDTQTLGILSVNRAALVQYGYSREEFLGLTVDDLRPSEDVPRFLEHLKQRPATMSRSGGWRHLRADGSVMHVEVFGRDVVWSGRSARLVTVVDVSERVRHERRQRRLLDQLRKERSTLRGLFEEAPTFIAVVRGPDHVFEMVNPAYRRLVGEEREILGKPLLEAVPEVAEQPIAGLLDHVLATGEPFTGEEKRILLRRTPDGPLEQRFVSFAFQPLRDADGHVTGVMTHGMDVTDHVRSNREVERANAERLAILEQLSEGVLVADPRGRIVFRNEAMKRIHPVPSALSDLLHADGTPFDPDDLPSMRALREGKTCRADVHMRRPDGSWVTTEASAAPILARDGSLLGAATVVRDVTREMQEAAARKESEQRLRGILESMVEGVVFIDPDGVVTFANRAAEDMLGTQGSAPGRLYDDPIWELTHPDGTPLPDEDRPFVKVLRQGSAVLGQEFGLTRPDGTRVILALTGEAMRDSDGKPQGMVLTMSDVTEAKELEQQLHQSQKMEAVGRLAGGVAHDFNNLLTTIQGRAEFLLADLQEHDPLREDAQEIMSAAERAAGLTRQLLAFSRKQPIRPRVLDVAGLLAGMEGMLRRLIGEDVALVMKMPEDLGAIRADPSHVEQVLLNLVVNARDAMPRGGELTIEARSTSTPPESGPVAPDTDTWVFLSVRDTGSGIPPEILEHIFEPFFTTKEAGKGTGLGLSTVYGVIQQNDGHIEVVSEAGRGAEFRIWFPVVRDEPDTVEPRARTGAALRAKGETILLVEDEETVRSLVRRFLKRMGYRVLEAANGGEALLLCESHDGPIDLVLTDVVMPHMSGQELVDRLRQVRSDWQVLFMSGYTADRIHDHGLSGQDAALLQKPFAPDDLARKIRDILDA